MLIEAVKVANAMRRVHALEILWAVFLDVKVELRIYQLMGVCHLYEGLSGVILPVGYSIPDKETFEVW